MDTKTTNGIETTPLLSKRSDETKLSLFQKVSYGFGHVYNDLCAAMWFSYMLFYLQIILQMEAKMAGALLMMGQVADAIATPIAGWLVDKYGTRRKWHIAGTIMVTVSFPLVFTYCFFCGTDQSSAQLMYYISMIILFQIGWAVVQISHLSIIPNLTSNSEQRSELTAIRYTGAVCSSVFVYIVTWLVLRIDAGDTKSIGPNDYYKFQEIILIIIFFGILAAFVFYYGVHCGENVSHPTNNGTVSHKDNISFKGIFITPLIYQVSLLYVASRLYMTLNLVYMPLYLDERVSQNTTTADTEDLRQSLASVPLVSFIASFLASLLLKYKSNYIGNKATYFLGSIISLTSCIWIGFYLETNTNMSHVYAVAILIGTGSSTTMVSSLCLTAEMIGLNSDKGAVVYSIVTFTDKLICGIAVVIIEHLKCEDKSMCPEYYRYVLAFVSSGATILGILILLTLYCTKVHTFISNSA